MNLIRMTALIAVTVSTLACNNVNEASGKDEIAGLKQAPADQEIQTWQQAGGGQEADSISPRQISHPKEDKPAQPAIETMRPDWDKKIIKTAVLNVEVKDYNKYYASLREKVKNLGGYIAQEEQVQSGYKVENTITIKIPVAEFDGALMEALANVEKVNEKKVRSQDVTIQTVDARSRLEAKKQVRAKYMELMKQAKSMPDILSLQSQINGIQEELEAAAGRIEYLGHSASFSTIVLTYYQVLDSPAKAAALPSFGNKIAIAFKSGGAWIADLMVGLVYLWPLLLLIVPLILFFNKSKKSKDKS